MISSTPQSCFEVTPGSRWCRDASKIKITPPRLIFSPIFVPLCYQIYPILLSSWHPDPSEMGFNNDSKNCQTSNSFFFDFRFHLGPQGGNPRAGFFETSGTSFRQTAHQTPTAPPSLPRLPSKCRFSSI